MSEIAQAVTTLTPALAGPGAAVLVLVGVFGAAYRLTVTHAFPVLTELGKRHLEQIDELIKTQKTESAAIVKSLASIDRRLARLEGLTDGGSFLPNAGLSPDRST